MKGVKTRAAVLAISSIMATVIVGVLLSTVVFREAWMRLPAASAVVEPTLELREVPPVTTLLICVPQPESDSGDWLGMQQRFTRPLADGSAVVLHIQYCIGA